MSSMFGPTSVTTTRVSARPWAKTTAGRMSSPTATPSRESLIRRMHVLPRGDRDVFKGRGRYSRPRTNGVGESKGGARLRINEIARFRPAGVPLGRFSAREVSSRLHLAQGERAEAPEMAPARRPSEIDGSLEGGSGGSEQTDHRSPAGQRRRSSPRLEAARVECCRQAGGEAVEARVRRGKAGEGGHIRHALGRAQPSPPFRPAQHEPILEEETLRVAHARPRVEEVEAPGFAARGAPDGPGLAEHGGRARSEIDLDALDEARSRRGNDVVGHVLEPRALADAEHGALDGHASRAPVDAGRA